MLTLALALVACATASAAQPFIVVASTTSTQDSGLFDDLLPKFEKKFGVDVRVVAVGTGDAIDIAERGDADVLFVHYKPDEEAFVEAGHGVKRFPVMYNDFIIVGPKSDPAKIAGIKDATDAFARIADAEAAFASRGDDSGTHQKELEIWEAADVDVEAASGTWYRSLGQGMGPTLNTAAGMDAYTLADRGTWISFNNRQNLGLLVAGDPELFNQYGVILVNPEKHPHVKAEEGQAFIDWLISAEGQKAIASYKLKGKQLFYPNANEPGA